MPFDRSFYVEESDAVLDVTCGAKVKGSKVIGWRRTKVTRLQDGLSFCAA